MRHLYPAVAEIREEVGADLVRVSQKDEQTDTEPIPLTYYIAFEAR